MIALTAHQACSWIYDPIAPDKFQRIFRVGETVCGIAENDGVLDIVLQGTENLQGWMADIDVLAFHHPTLGRLHSGFYKNIPTLLGLLKPFLTIPIRVSGHSKGSGEAVQLAGELHAAGYDVVQAVLFACPNAGDQQFANYMQKNVPGISFRNASKYVPTFGDPVPCVPLWPYVRPYPWAVLHVAPPGMKRFIEAEWHRAEHYLAGAITFS